MSQGQDRKSCSRNPNICQRCSWLVDEEKDESDQRIATGAGQLAMAGSLRIDAENTKMRWQASAMGARSRREGATVQKRSATSGARCLRGGMNLALNSRKVAVMDSWASILI